MTDQQKFGSGGAHTQSQATSRNGRVQHQIVIGGSDQGLCTIVSQTATSSAGDAGKLSWGQKHPPDFIETTFNENRPPAKWEAIL
jgi:hypothetical protein